VACGLLVVLGRRFFDRSIALVAGILLATSPFFVKWSQQARGYTILVALALAATLALLRASERNTRGAWALYGLALSAVIVWHPVGGLLLLPAQLVLLRQHRERVFPHALLAGVVVMLLGVPWAAQIALRSTGQGVEMNWLKFPSADVAARAFLDVSGAAGLGFLVAGLGLVLLVRRGQTSIAAWLGTWALAPFVLALAISPSRSSQRSRSSGSRRLGERPFSPPSSSRAAWASSVGTARGIAETGAARTGVTPSQRCALAKEMRPSWLLPGKRARRRRTTAPRWSAHRERARSGCSPGRRRSKT
jgi:4-amino-4-deoxy-L-arabinose transferase-like glycosyltransferase